MTEIGYQHGIVAGMNGLRDLDPSKTLLKKVDGKWPSIDSLMVPLDQWKAWDKMERAFTILVHDHDAALAGGGSPDPQPPLPPDGGGGEPTRTLAPQTYNQGSHGQGARFCTRDSGNPDGGGFSYDENGLCRGGRSEKPVPGLKPSDMMDDKGACDGYEWMGRTFPPWPDESYTV